MPNATTKKVFITVLTLIVVGMLASYFYYRHNHSISETSAGPLSSERNKIEAYLKLHNRDAASLLAAFHASGADDQSAGDVVYLKEAATRFPNDPQVQLTVLAQNVFPEDRRKWLAAFKESSPDNSLANYLSAADYFKEGHADLAMQELSEATDKQQFADFSLTNYLAAMDFQQFDGKPSLLANTAALSAMSSDMMPLLADFKRVANGILDAQKQPQSVGDKKSLENLSRLGLKLAGRFSAGDGGRFVISQLVGQAIENIMLKNLDQNATYDFLNGQTPAQRLKLLAQRKAEFRELTKVMGPYFAMLPESEQNAYFERMKTEGEAAAMRWLKEQHPNASQ